MKKKLSFKIINILIPILFLIMICSLFYSLEIQLKNMFFTEPTLIENIIITGTLLLAIVLFIILLILNNRVTRVLKDKYKNISLIYSILTIIVVIILFKVLENKIYVVHLIQILIIVIEVLITIKCIYRIIKEKDIIEKEPK